MREAGWEAKSDFSASIAVRGIHSRLPFLYNPDLSRRKASVKIEHVNPAHMENQIVEGKSTKGFEVTVVRFAQRSHSVGGKHPLGT